MAFYETVFVVRQDMSAAQVNSLTEFFSKAAQEMGGKILKSEYWGLKKMAYDIKKNPRAHYVMLHLDAPSEAVKEMERQMRINEDVLRYMSVKAEKLEEGPSIMMRQSRKGYDEDQDAVDALESNEVSHEK